MTLEFEENRVVTIFKAPLVSFFVGIFLFIALLYRQNDLALLALLVLGVMTAAKIWSSMSHYRLRYTINIDKQRAFPGETLALETMVENAKLLPVRIRIQWSLNLSLEKIGGEEQNFRQEAGLLWYQRVHLHSNIVARRRGVYQVGPNCIQAGDLFGFFEKEKKSRKTTSIIVYPRLVCLKSIGLPMRELFGVPGVKSPVQDPVYILGTRDYQPSRPSRHIHWKASARHNRLQEKVFEPSQQEKVLLTIEVSQFEKADAAENFERTLEGVGSLAVQFDQKGYAIGFVTNGVVEGGQPFLPMGRSRQQLASILEILARLKMRTDANLVDTLSRVLELPWGLSSVHFSYTHDDATRKAANYFSHRRIPVIFVVCTSPSQRAVAGHQLAAKKYCLDEICIKDAQIP